MHQPSKHPAAYSHATSASRYHNSIFRNLEREDMTFLLALTAFLHSDCTWSD